MKITKKRVATATAIAALLTAGIFGGTYAKYLLEVDTKSDTAHVAKFYLGTENVDLFSATYTNATGMGVDIATTSGDKLFAPNFTTTGTLTYKVTSEVKAELTFGAKAEVTTNLPADIQQNLNIVIGDPLAPIYAGTVYDLNRGAAASRKIKDISANTINDTVTVPVTVSWDLNNSKDPEETALATAQYDGSTDYTLSFSANAVLTQVD